MNYLIGTTILCTIDYFKELTSTLQVEISSDLKYVAFANNGENYLMERIDVTDYNENTGLNNTLNSSPGLRDNKSYTYLQRDVDLLNERIVRGMFYDSKKGDFYFINCSEYDQYLYLQNHTSKNFQIPYDCNVEPGIL